ncbi:MAG: hypothetical protein AAF456_13845 [Planctomycetota bacterium]
MQRILFCALLMIGACVCNTSANADTIFFQPGFTDEVWRFDTDSGTETFVGNMGISAGSMGFSFLGDTLYAFNRDDGGLYTVDTSSGAASLVGFSGLNSAESLTFDGAGNLYTMEGFALIQLSILDGSATSLGSLSTNIDGLSYDPISDRIIGVDSGTLYEIDPGTLMSTSIGSTSGADETLAFGPDGTLYGHGDDFMFYEIDLTTGGATFIGNTSSRFVFASAVSQVIPEPGSFLICAGSIGMLVLRRRR